MARVSEILLYKHLLIFGFYLSIPVLVYGKMYMHMELHNCVFPVGKNIRLIQIWPLNFPCRDHVSFRTFPTYGQCISTVTKTLSLLHNVL
jgi:hypothetical protein